MRIVRLSVLKSTGWKRHDRYAGFRRKWGGTGSRTLVEGWVLDRRRNRCCLVHLSKFYTHKLSVWNLGDEQIPLDGFKSVPHVMGCGCGMHMKAS